MKLINTKIQEEFSAIRILCLSFTKKKREDEM